MKKSLLALFSIISILFFSCASKDEIKNEAASALEEQQIETPSQVEEQAVTQADEVALSSSDKNQDQTTATFENNAGQTDFLADSQVEQASEDEDSDVLLVNELVYEQLEEIIEPEVFELEPPEEPEELPEPVAQELTLEEVEIVEENNIQHADEAEFLTEVAASTDEDVANTDEVVAIQTMDTTFDDEVISIDDENDDVQNTDNTQTDEALAVAPAIEISRSVTLKRMEYLEVNYPGNGWIYMGITDGSKNLTNLGRKVGTQNTTFTLIAKNPGTKILHFYKNDAVTNTFIDDYLEVIILDEKGSNKNHVKAPAYKVPVPKKQVKTEPIIEETLEEPQIEVSQADKVTAPPKKAEPEPMPASQPEQQLQNDDEVEVLEEPVTQATENEEINCDDLLKQIKDLYNSKDYSSAINKLKLFFEVSTTKCDEALYIQGQIYEAKSSVQNINAAIDSYTTLTKNYPASRFWDDANKRIIYLKRFYLEGR